MISKFITLLAVGGVGICQMMFSSSLVAISGSGDGGLSPRKVIILNTKVTKIDKLKFQTLFFTREEA